jgi:universal stress protein E
MLPTLAFEQAAELARGMKATLRIVAFVDQEMVDREATFNETNRHSHQSPLRTFQQWLANETEHLRAGELHVCAEVIWGERTVARMCDYIKEAEADYVLKDMEEDAASGSPTFSALDRQLLHESPVPVLLIRNNGHSLSRKIVAAVDILHDEPEVRQTNRISIESAMEVAKACHATLHLLSVYDREALPVVKGDEHKLASLLTYEKARNRFDALADQYSITDDCRHFVVGASARAINDYLTRCHFDILAFGAVDPVANDLLLGRTRQTVLGRPPCSILALKYSERV